MVVHFTPDQEEILLRIAQQNGVDSEQLVKDAAMQLVADDTAIRAGILRGLEQADRGNLLSHEEVRDRVKRFLQS